MKIGLVIACKAEFNEFIKLFPKHKIKDYGNFKVYIVNYFGNKIFCVRSGVTRINAAIKTQFLIDKFKVDMIINAGTCAHLKGKAEVGDKTMVDALAPAVEALERNSGKSFLEMLKAAEIAAKQGVENTKKYQAKFGRAKSLMERAVGYQDAGATSVWLIFQGMREFVEG